VQVLIISGRVGRDAKLRQTSGDDVLNFSLAVSNGKDRDGKEREATWYDCALWGKRAAALEQYVTKGTSLTLRGRPTSRVYEGKSYLGITVDELDFMGRSGGSEGGSRRERDDEDNGERSARPKASQKSAAEFDDEVPF
jgi:single-strand DNA-binding protein